MRLAGVGLAAVLGWLRSIPVRLEHLQLSVDFAVLADSEPIFLLGIDQLRKFHCVVDLDERCLRFGAGAALGSVPFLSRLPEHQDVSSCLDPGPLTSLAGCTIS